MYARGVQVYLLRTSLLAARVSDDAPPFLSAEGRQLARAVGSRVQTSEAPSFDAVLVSPVPAAVQTAELFADRVDYLGAPEVLATLVGGVPAPVLGKLVLARGASVLVVADEPSLSELGAFLVGRPTFPQLKPGQVSVIVDGRPAWCFRPGELARALLLVA